jgi:beta-lactam-binding protein with PASTA domain/predicted Ser/Thr protein kinase
VNGTVLGDRYQVQARIGSGGMAEVYRGHDPVLNRTVAIKILLSQWARDASFVDRFRREAQAAARLNHQNVVAVYDSGADGDTQWIVMEFIEGKTLHEFLSDGRRPTVVQACEIVGSICGALASAHAQGVIHRDIKPANVMVTRDGTVKLMDLGIARLVAGPETAPQTSAILGTASYMSPEQAQGRPVDERTDLYSTGAVLYELLTGRPPHTGDSPVAIAYKQVNEVPPPPSEINSDVTPALDAVVMRALAKNPANRYQSAREFADDLERVRTGQDVQATPLLAAGGATATQVISRPQPTSVLPPREEPPGSGRKVWLGVLIGVLVIAVLTALGFLLAGVLTNDENPNDLEPRAVPSVIGVEEDEAITELNDAGFTQVEVERRVVEDDADIGRVIEQDPEAETIHDPDTTPVTIVVGRRPPSVEVPLLTGSTQDEAQQLLEAEGLLLGDVTEEPSDAEVGTVIAQNPPAGDEVERDSFVDIVVSSGPDTVVVEDVVCYSFVRARNTLERQGLQVELGDPVAVNPACPNPNKVAAQDPEGGTEVEEGSTVTLFTGTPPSPPEDG